MANQYKNKVVYNGTTLIDLSDTTAVQSDVASGKFFYLATGEKVEGTNSGGGGDEPSEPTYKTYFDDSINVGEHGISIASLADLYFAQGETWRVTWDGVEYICTTMQYQGWLWTVGNQSLASTDDGVNEPFLLYNYGGGAMNGNTRTGGTHTLKLEKQTSSGGGGGGSAMNVQTAQSTDQRNNTALGSVTSLTCQTAGTYDVYWTCARTSTSGTWGSQLYINGTAYGTENTTFSNNVQNNHLTGVQIPANATVAIYGRSRSDYYIYVPQLTIVQTA